MVKNIGSEPIMVGSDPSFTIYYVLCYFDYDYTLSS